MVGTLLVFLMALIILSGLAIPTTVILWLA
uniref:Uncharacterized protein n=1 Tax=Arundo donax TaxID=35708 RepID=A0A0A8ZLP1_ARUDO